MRNNHDSLITIIMGEVSFPFSEFLYFGVRIKVSTFTRCKVTYKWVQEEPRDQKGGT